MKCAAEFATKRFALGSSLSLWPCADFSINSVINLVAGGERIYICAGNKEKIAPDDLVYCARCDLCCGKMYGGTVALVLYDTNRNAQNRYILDAPSDLPADLPADLPYRRLRNDPRWFWQMAIRRSRFGPSEIRELNLFIKRQNMYERCRRYTRDLLRSSSVSGAQVWRRYAGMRWVSCSNFLR